MMIYKVIDEYEDYYDIRLIAETYILSSYRLRQVHSLERTIYKNTYPELKFE